jgi:hypothetical protein
MVRGRRWRAAVVALALAAGVLGAQPAAAQALPEAAQNFDHLIGRVTVGSTPPPVAGWTYSGGTILRDRSNLWMTVYRTPSGRYVFITERFLRRTADGMPVWRYLDTATSRTNFGRFRYWVAPHHCERGNNDLLAVGLASGRDPYDNPAIQLWNWHPLTGRLSERGTAGVTCWTGNPD